jgi:threonine/homoserine/homoserine lactone efflux protein
MTELWLALLPILLAMMISPARTITVILLLHTPKGARTALGYVGGMITSMMVQGIVLGFLLSFVGLATDSRQADLALVVSVLFVVGGIVMLTGSSKFIFQDDDDDKPPPKWLEQLESLEPRAAFATGFGWLMVSPKQWVFVLTAVAIIFTASLTAAASLLNWLLFSVLIQVVYFVLIAFYVLMPERSAAILDGLFNWLKRNLRVVAIVLFVGLGLFFLIKGFMGLAA